MGMTWSIIEYYFVRFGFLQSTNNNMFSALRVAAKRTATVARPTFARRALSAAHEGGKMEIVDADITDSIEWCMPSPPPQVRTLRSVFSFSFAAGLIHKHTDGLVRYRWSGLPVLRSLCFVVVKFVVVGFS